MESALLRAKRAGARSARTEQDRPWSLPSRLGGGGAGLRRGVPSAHGGGGSKESAPVPHPDGRREAPECEAQAFSCDSTGGWPLSPSSVAGDGGRDPGGPTPHSPLAEVHCPSAYAQCSALAAETTAPGVQRARRRAAPPAPGRSPGPCGSKAGPSRGPPLSSVPPGGGRHPAPAVVSQRIAAVTRQGLFTGTRPPSPPAAGAHLSRSPRRGPVTERVSFHFLPPPPRLGQPARPPGPAGLRGPAEQNGA